jgi:hypothetical protein
MMTQRRLRESVPAPDDEDPVSGTDRVTVPVDLSGPALESARELQATLSDIRPAVPLVGVPWLVITYDVLQKLPLDARAGYVVSRIDGKCTVEMLLDIAGMPAAETLEILRRLVRLGAVELRGGD